MREEPRRRKFMEGGPLTDFPGREQTHEDEPEPEPDSNGFLANIPES